MMRIMQLAFRHKLRVFVVLVAAAAQVLALSLWAAPTVAADADAAKAVDGEAILREAWQVVNDRFYDRQFNGIDWPAILEKHLRDARKARDREEVSQVVNAMLAELHTSHMAHYTPDDREYYELIDVFHHRGGLQEARELFGRRGPRYAGLGIVTKVIDGKTFIADVIDRMPGDKAGLKVGDEIVSVDDDDFHPIKSFRGKVGETVRMFVQRSADETSREIVEVQPEWIRPHQMFLESIKSSARIIQRGDRRIAYVRIRSYAATEFQESLVGLVTGDGPLADADALVLDIRGGWGGASPEYLNLFNDDVPAMLMKNQKGEQTSYDRQWRKPAVLLIDGGSRSGKEVIAYGFKKSKIGPLVGKRTAGAVVGGSPALLSDRSFLLVAVTDVHIDGERLEGHPVQPDVEVDFDLRYAEGVDPQFERAMDEAMRLIR
jgi:carboxyl-terminal processing protease